MELVWATEQFVIGGQSYPGFPILLNDNMESLIPANEFFRSYLLRGAIGSNRSWPCVGRALYDFLSFLQAHELDWKDVDRGEAKTLIAAYRDYSKAECGLAIATIRQRIHYICQFYAYALSRGWVNRLPFTVEDRRSNRAKGFLAHVDASSGSVSANDLMPKKQQHLPKFLNLSQIKLLLGVIKNHHHKILIRLALKTGLRREELATFPLAYVFDPKAKGITERNVKITLNPYDGTGMRTKGQKVRDIYVSSEFWQEIANYVRLYRGERSSLTGNEAKTLFVNQMGQHYSGDGKGIERIVRDWGKKANLKAHPHMLRHTYATHTLAMLQRSKGDVDPLVFLQRQLGHSSIETTSIYLHLVNEIADEAVLDYDRELNDSIEFP
ncbi:tyrosine-type recombinase/integrase [Pseudomonas khavaziana]|uniref:tyrosine-type recombinase/integrase n=1 Tax=Pseudomonas khavaziana TaxID=2842351 RepID=UPI001C3C43AA|nr:tyrosine-type recombinase/integrase [Pseudomonas khavaziana]MBV4478633.1 tyrosine-type recombinase/integrase [Pseudomonas khavaziana]